VTGFGDIFSAASAALPGTGQDHSQLKIRRPLFISNLLEIRCLERLNAPKGPEVGRCSVTSKIRRRMSPPEDHRSIGEGFYHVASLDHPLFSLDKNTLNGFPDQDPAAVRDSRSQKKPLTLNPKLGAPGFFQ